MKKITLAIFAIAGFVGGVFGQAVITPTVPTINASTQVRLPDGTALSTHLRGVMLLRAADLTALTAQNITGADFIMLDGTDPATSVGTMSLWVENTADVTNNKTGLGFAGAIATMSLTANGVFNISTVAQTSLVPLAGFSAFTYTGAGLYVAWEYDNTAPAPNTNTWSATWAANNAGTGNALCATSSASTTLGASNTLSSTDFRPCIRFTAANTATNELSVDALYAPGKIAKLSGAPQSITAIVTNKSNVAKTAVSVGLASAGTNTFTDLQVIPTLAAGASTVITFSPFVVTANGINTLVVSVLPDQNNSNNSLSWTQSVTCNEMGNNPFNFSFDNAFGYGGTGSGYFVTGHTLPVTASLTGIRYAVASASQNTVGANKTIYGVLLDAAGTLITTSTNTITITTPMMNTFVTFNFANEQLTANTQYLYGVAQPAGGYYPLAIADASAFPAPIAYSNTPIGGGAPVAITSFGGYMGIEPVLSFSSTIIGASATATSVCKTSPKTVTITATGADSYTYSAAGLGNGSTAVYTPTAAGTATLTQISVVGSYTSGAAAGCKSSTVGILFSLAACTGVAENTGELAVKVMPNPSVSGKTTVSNLHGVNTIMVYNTLGQAVVTRQTSNETETIDLSNFPAGNYLVRITDSNNDTRVVKLVNQN